MNPTRTFEHLLWRALQSDYGIIVRVTCGSRDALLSRLRNHQRKNPEVAGVAFKKPAADRDVLWLMPREEPCHTKRPNR